VNQRQLKIGEREEMSAERVLLFWQNCRCSNCRKSMVDGLPWIKVLNLVLFHESVKSGCGL